MHLIKQMWIYRAGLKGLLPLCPLGWLRECLADRYLFSDMWHRCAGLAVQFSSQSCLPFGSTEHPLAFSAHGGVIPGGPGL